MGAYLSQPVTEKDAEEKESQDFKYGACAMQGWRTEMEDAHLAALDFDTNSSLFGVFDGHGGSEVAKFAAIYLAKELLNTPAYQASDNKEALVQSFLKIDELLALESTQAELHTLAGPQHADDEEDCTHEQQKQGTADKGGGSRRVSAMLSEENLPELLRQALQQKREEDEREGVLGSGSDEDYEDAASPNRDSEGSSGSGLKPGTALAHWKSTADSAPDSQAARLSKESIVPQRSDAVHDQPTSDGNKGPVNKRPRGPDHVTSPSPESSSPPESASLAPVSRRSKAKARATVKRNKFSEPLLDEAYDSDDPEHPVAESVEKAEPIKNAATEYKGPSAGCTAVVALVQGDTLLVANAGDSRCVVSEGGKAIAMSYDHKPTDASEHSRITKAGGLVMDGRVNGSLNLSRALGDMEYKQSKHLPPAEQIVTAYPDVRQLQLGADVEFMILACDGIWDVLTNQQAVDFVRQRLLEGQSPKYISECVCEHCLAKDTGGTGIGCDNMSVMVILFKRFASFGQKHADSMAANADATNLYSSSKA